MKNFITPPYIFTPGTSGTGTVFLDIPSFDVKLLAAIINQSRGAIIYCTGDPNNRFTNVFGSALTLFADTSTHASTDILQILYNEPKQDDLQEAIYDILSRLSFLTALRGSDGTIRASIIAGALSTVATVSTVSTVSTVGNLPTIGNVSASSIAPNLMNTAAILSNINNVVT